MASWSFGKKELSDGVAVGTVQSQRRAGADEGEVVRGGRRQEDARKCANLWAHKDVDAPGEFSAESGRRTAWC